MDSEKLTPYLRRRCLALRVEDRVALVAVLTESLTPSPRTAGKERERLENMAEKMQEITGLNIMQRTRLAEYVRARVVFAFVARMEGYSQNCIARFLKMNHATIHFMEKRIAVAFDYPEMYPDYIDLYNNFTNAIL